MAPSNARSSNCPEGLRGSEERYRDWTKLWCREMEKGRHQANVRFDSRLCWLCRRLIMTQRYTYSVQVSGLINVLGIQQPYRGCRKVVTFMELAAEGKARKARFAWNVMKLQLWNKTCIHRHVSRCEHLDYQSLNDHTSMQSVYSTWHQYSTVGMRDGKCAFNLYRIE